MTDQPLAPPPTVLDLQAAIAARRTSTDDQLRRHQTYDVVTMSLALMMLLDGDETEARILLADSSLTVDEVTAIGEAGTRLGRIAPQVVRGRRR